LVPTNILEVFIKTGGSLPPIQSAVVVEGPVRELFESLARFAGRTRSAAILSSTLDMD
jgi:hypothetical protein